MSAAPIYFPDDPFGPSKAVTSYTELMTSIRGHIETELQVRQLDFDRLAGFPAGLTGKAFGMLQVKRLGVEKLFDAIRAAGLRLRIEVDPEQLAMMKGRIEKKLMHPRQANQARPGHCSSPASKAVLSRVFKPLARLGGKARQRSMTKAERSAHAKHAINTRWIAVRKRKKRNRAKRQDWNVCQASNRK